MRIRYKSAASRYAAAERRADAEREAGIPDRLDEDQREPWSIVFGSIRWTATPRRGYKTWRITDESGALIACCTAKGVARLLLGRV